MNTAPESDQAANLEQTPSESRSLLKIISAILACLFFLSCMFLPRLIEPFRDMFKDLEVEVPMITQLFLSLTPTILYGTGIVVGMLIIVKDFVFPKKLASVLNGLVIGFMVLAVPLVIQALLIPLTQIIQSIK